MLKVHPCGLFISVGPFAFIDLFTSMGPFHFRLAYITPRAFHCHVGPFQPVSPSPVGGSGVVCAGPALYCVQSLNRRKLTIQVNVMPVMAGV